MSSLAELKKGEKARIISFTNQEIGSKLMEMGCLPGEIIEVSKTAPLGCPLAIEIAGYELSMRRQEAATVLIERLN
jgi:ferrous iron transport protein A